MQTQHLNYVPHFATSDCSGNFEAFLSWPSISKRFAAAYFSKLFHDFELFDIQAVLEVFGIAAAAGRHGGSRVNVQVFPAEYSSERLMLAVIGSLTLCYLACQQTQLVLYARRQVRQQQLGPAHIGSGLSPPEPGQRGGGGARPDSSTEGRGFLCVIGHSFQPAFVVVSQLGPPRGDAVHPAGPLG